MGEAVDFCPNSVTSFMDGPYMFLDEETALGIPQLSLRFLHDSNSWNVNG